MKPIQFILLIILITSGIEPVLYSQEKTGLDIGEEAPNIIEKGIDGQTIALDSLRGKVVLIDFWASYCIHCRQKHKLLVPLYEKYKDTIFTNGNGFTVFSVSLDKNKDRWIKAIKEDGLKWPYHVSDLDGIISSQHKKTYNAFFIPINYLIDGNGVIIGKNLFGEELDETLKQLCKQNQ